MTWQLGDIAADPWADSDVGLWMHGYVAAWTRVIMGSRLHGLLVHGYMGT